jgi:hypothetical protein
MNRDTGPSTQQGLTTLAQGALADIEKLIGQHLDLLRSDLKEEFSKAKTAGLSLAGGAGLSSLGGLLGVLALVHGLHALTRLPLWACYGLIGTALGVGGATFLRTGTQQAADIQVVPQRTTEVLRHKLSGAAG